MKPYFFAALSCLSLAYCLADGADLTLYRNVVSIEGVTVSQPSIVEVTGLNYTGNYVLATAKGVVVPQQINRVQKISTILPKRAEGCTTTCTNALALADGDEKTTFDFPILKSGVQKGTIKISYTAPLETDSIVFKATSDSYMPSAFTLVVDGKRVLNTISGGRAKFPKMVAQNVEIEFEYSQPIRFTEVGVGSNTEEELTSSLRFVYQPNESYLLYTDSPTGRGIAPAPPIDLFSKKVEASATLGAVSKNAVYKERDTDSDGAIDSTDNCPMQANADQRDGNNNGIGDACDDYDYDGIMTAVDNCPTEVNPNQSDTDRDGIGDACDQEESRITEKYGWIPWVVFAGVFLAVMAMGYEVVKMKKKGEVAKEGDK